MMKIIDRYFLRELFGPFLLGLMTFTVVLFLKEMIRLAELMLNKGVGVVTIGRMIVSILPSFLALTIPMAVLLSTLIAFGRLSADNEIIAFSNQGISLYRLGRPVMWFGLLTTLATLGIMFQALPWGNHSFKTIFYELARKTATIGLEQGVFNTDFSDMVIYVNEVEHRSGLMKGILIQQPGPEKEEITIFARRGGLTSDAEALEIYLEDVLIQSRSESKKTLTITRSPQYLQRLNFEKETRPGFIPKGEREMTLAELLSEADRRRGRGLSDYSLRVEMHKKFAIPFACLVFTLLGVPLGLLARHSDRLVGFGISMIVFFLYYIFLTAGETLGDRGIVPPFIGMWWANVFFGVIGILLYQRVARDRPLKMIQRAGDLVWNLKKKLRGIRR